MNKKGWIGFDLDGVLAEYHGFQNTFEIGAPIPCMVTKVKQLLADGWQVKIFTARVDGGIIFGQMNPSLDRNIVELYRQVGLITKMIQDWTEKHIGARLPVTCQKDAGMQCLYDDRCVQVENNTGRITGIDLIPEPCPRCGERFTCACETATKGKVW